MSTPSRRGSGIDLVVVNWNTAGWVLYLAEQLQRCPGWERLLVVDNGSHPNDLRALRQFLPKHCELAPLGMNVGVAGAWNEGWLRTSAAVVALLNVDLRIHRPDCLHRAGELFAADPRLGVLSIADNEPPAWFRAGRIVGGALVPPDRRSNATASRGRRTSSGASSAPLTNPSRLPTARRPTTACEPGSAAIAWRNAGWGWST